MKWKGIIGALVSLGLIVGSGVAQGTSPSDAVATAQSALVTAQAGLRTPTIAPTATVFVAATTTPVATATKTVAPTRTPAMRPTATTAPTATPGSIRGNTSTATAVPRPTERPTVIPTPLAPTPTPPQTGVLQTYTSLAIIPTTYIIDGQTLRLSIAEISAARAEAQRLDGRVVKHSNGMARVTVNVVTDDYPVSTFRVFCSGNNCGKYVGPTDIRSAIAEHGGGGYDFVHTYVPDEIDGVEVMDCPCSGVAITRYFSDQMYGTSFNATTQLHETGHVIGDFWLRSQGYDNLPVCDYDYWPMHCGYVMGGANLAWMDGYYSGTLRNGWGINRSGWLYQTPRQKAADEGRAGDEFVWTGREQPVAGHTDPEDPAMLEGIQPDGTFCHGGICS